MNNFVDEVLNGEPKYRVMNENNVVIHDNAKIEMVTSVITQGTALNKAFFDSIQKDITRLELIKKYNTTSVSSTSGVDTSDVLGSGWTADSSYTGVIHKNNMTINTSTTSTTETLKGWDGNDSTYFETKSMGAYAIQGINLTQEISIDFGVATRIRKATIKIGNYGNASMSRYTTFYIIGNNTGTTSSDFQNGVILGSQQITTSGVYSGTITFSTEGEYRYYGIFTKDYHLGNVYKWEMIGVDYSSVLALTNTAYDNYTANDIVKMKTPTLDSKIKGHCKLNINNKGVKEITPKTIESNSYYTLVYNGTNFVAKKDF